MVPGWGETPDRAHGKERSDTVEGCAKGKNRPRGSARRERRRKRNREAATQVAGGESVEKKTEHRRSCPKKEIKEEETDQVRIGLQPSGERTAGRPSSAQSRPAWWQRSPPTGL